MNNISLEELLAGLDKQESNSDLVAPILTFLITKQEELFSNIRDLLVEIRDKKQELIDFSPVSMMLEQIRDKEFPEYPKQNPAPKVQKVFVENQVEDKPEIELLLRELLTAIRDLKNEEKTIVIENKMPLDRRPLALPVTGMGSAEFRKYKARYHKINVKPQESFDGVRTVFTLIHLPEAGTDECWVGGIKLTQDAGDYTLVAQTATFTTPPASQPYFNYDVL